MRVAGLAATTISICLSGLWAQDVQRSPSTVASAEAKGGRGSSFALLAFSNAC